MIRMLSEWTAELWFRLRFWWWRTFHPKQYAEEYAKEIKTAGDIAGVMATMAIIATLVSNKNTTTNVIKNAGDSLSEALGVAKEPPNDPTI